MQKLITRLIVFPIFAVFTNQSLPVWDIVSACHIPNESLQGLCRDHIDCPAYRQINDVTSIGNMSRLSFIKQIQCSGEQQEGKVCCPRDGRLYSDPWIDVTNVTTREHVRPLVIKSRIGSQEMQCGWQDAGNKVNHGKITEIDEFPWMALLVYEKAMNPVVPGCGGALISESFVVTAAHCLVGPILQKKGNLKFVRVGEYNLNDDPDCTIIYNNLRDCTDGKIDVKPKNTIVHPEYVAGATSQHHDIGLVQLERPLEFSAFISPICLPDPGTSTLNEKFSVCGWGRTDFFRDGLGRRDKIPSPIKLKTYLRYFDHGKCSEIYQPQRLINGQICAGGKAEDTCSGDSGSPLMFFDRNKGSWMLNGLVSIGPQNCGTAGKPGIYTNVKEYVQWIRTNAHLYMSVAD